MILVKPSHEILSIQTMDDGGHPLRLIELAGRTCYKSEDKITVDSAKEFVRMIVKRGHHSVIEHSQATVRFICDRGVSHELVRHRLAAYSQESTRYCNYSGGVTFIIPQWCNIKPGQYAVGKPHPVDPCADTTWLYAMSQAERRYLALLKAGWSPQQARSVLPNSLKTEIVVSANFREWRHILTLRTSKAAHPQMREIMIPLLSEFKNRIPAVFDDIEN